MVSSLLSHDYISHDSHMCVHTFSGLDSSSSKEVMREESALGMRAVTKRRTLRTARSVELQPCTTPDAILTKCTEIYWSITKCTEVYQSALKYTEAYQSKYAKVY